MCAAQPGTARDGVAHRAGPGARRVGMGDAARGPAAELDGVGGCLLRCSPRGRRRRDGRRTTAREGSGRCRKHVCRARSWFHANSGYPYGKTWSSFPQEGARGSASPPAWPGPRVHSPCPLHISACISHDRPRPCLAVENMEGVADVRAGHSKPSPSTPTALGCDGASLGVAAGVAAVAAAVAELLFEPRLVDPPPRPPRRGRARAASPGCSRRHGGRRAGGAGRVAGLSA